MHEIFVVSNDKSFRKGFCSNYLGMLILCEALHRLRLDQFFLNVDGSIYDQLWQHLEDMESNISKPNNLNEVQNVWNECKELPTTFTSDLEHFINQASAYNRQFRYWSIFLDELTPVIMEI